MRKLLIIGLAFVMLLCAAGCDELFSDEEDYGDEYSHGRDDEYEDFDDSGDYEPDYGGSDVSGGSAYSGDGSQSAWTVFIYLCGTDLESESAAATYNLAELSEAEASDEVRFVVQTGGTAQWQNEVIDSDVIQRWALEDGEYLLADERPLANMGEADTLGDFLNWGVSNFPAQKYMVIMWNHGGGSVAGVAFDELYHNDSLDLQELAEGLSMAGTEFELIGFDACLMASLETAAAIAPYGNYMVASEEYEPGEGWAYTELANYLAQNPSADGEAVGKVICDSYFSKCAQTDSDDMATLSVVKLSMIDALIDSFDAMAVEMSGVTGDIETYRTLIRGVNRAENYGGNTDEEGYTNMVDLGDLVMNTQDVLSDTADGVLDALFDAVVYNVYGDSRKNANGLSVFFPINSDDSELDSFAQISPSAQYVRFVEAVSGWNAPSQTVAGTEAVESVSQDDYDVVFSTFIDEDGYYNLVIESDIEAVASVQFALYYMDYEYNEYMLMGYDNDIDAYWDEGWFLDNFRGVWTAIEGCYCAPTLIAEEDDYNLYSIPILLNGRETNLRAAYIWDSDEEGHFEVLGAWDGLDTETGMSAKEIIKLKDGDEITFLFHATDMATGESLLYETDSFVVRGEVVMEEIELFDGDYLYTFRIIDVFGREYISDAVILECDNGEIYIYETEENT
ncbi:MAG: clostripain-related cysteine peptidase [Clostridia bacterium]|nr:clostripain-related cysteine peptidase [Clostridia bacterium]